MNFKNKEDFAEWLGNTISDKLNAEDVYAEFGAYGRCELFVNLNNGDMVTLGITMEDKDYKPR